jgi:hypothetical protein
MMYWPKVTESPLSSNFQVGNANIKWIKAYQRLVLIWSKVKSITLSHICKYTILGIFREEILNIVSVEHF